MSDHLPDVELSAEQNDRAIRLNDTITLAGGWRRAARLIVHLQDELNTSKTDYELLSADYRQLQEDNARLRSVLAKPAHERESPHCSTCACGMPAEPPQPDMLHPKIQALISQKARLEIERNMIATIIKDGPDADLYGLSDYETELHDQLREKLRASQPPVVTPTDYWRCPCCRNYYSGERLVCPISGDSRPSETTEGAPK